VKTITTLQSNMPTKYQIMKEMQNELLENNLIKQKRKRDYTNKDLLVTYDKASSINYLSKK